MLLELEKPLYRFMFFVVGTFALAGLLIDGPAAALRGQLMLQLISTRLLNDFTAIAGTGATLLNSAIVGVIALGIIRMNRIRLAGPTIATVFTMMGFSLFGTTISNILPIFLGVYLAARLVGTPFKHYLLIALFGTALGPATDFIANEVGLTGIAAIAGAIGVGTVLGLILPATAMTMLRLHEGFNLYNMGMTSGFIGLFASSLFAAAGHDVSLTLVWNENPHVFLAVLIPGISLVSMVWGLSIDGKKTLKGFLDIMSMSGRLPSDFMELASPGAALFNMGVLGLLASAYVFAVGGDFNGPVLGGLMTIIGFAGFGKHPKNCAPVVAGIVAATLFFGKSLNDPIPLLAALFGTTLAPLAGEFGPVAGTLAGFIHLAVVERSAAWHGGMNLYNNGFSGGLVATLFMAVLEWHRSNKTRR